MMDSMQKISIETPQEEAHKLIKWYGWITIIVLCVTPLVFILLPILVMNTSRIGKMIRESRVSEEEGIAGTLTEAQWEFNTETGLHHVKGQLTLLPATGEAIKCSFLKYVAPNQDLLPAIKVGDAVEITGQYKPLADLIDATGDTPTEPTNEKIFAIKNMRNLADGTIYTSEPILRVY